MNKEKLRIGNWVAFKKKSKGGFDYTTLTKSCFEGDYIEKKFEGILLNEDWMIRFGFEKRKTRWYKTLNSGRIIYYLNKSIFGILGTRYVLVHDFQNTFFKHNKEELIYENCNDAINR